MAPSLRRNPNREFEELREAAVKARAPFDKDMLLNLAFFLDAQYSEWVSEGSFIRTIPRDKKAKHAPRPVVNKIMHFVAQEHSYVMANQPTADVLPATDDPVDISHASVALNYLRWLCEPQVGDFDAELSDAAWWALVAGEGFIKWPFNAKEKRPDFMSVSPFDLLTDPYATKFRNSRYIIHSQFMDIEQVYNIYGKEIPPSTVSKQDQERAALMRELGHAPVLSGAIVNELWQPPGGRRHPEGRFVVWAGNETLVEPDKYPYDHGQLPFTQIGVVPRPNSLHYTTPVKYLRSPQMELNKYHAQRIMVREKFSNPKWWIPEELELQADPDDSPNQILRGNSQQGQFRPEIIQPTTFPEGTDGNWITSEMQDVVGLHEVSQGQVPGRVEAAKAIESLKEADLSRLQEMERTIKRAVSEGFWQCLMLAKQYVSDEQIVQTYSREGLPEVKRFKAEIINPGMRIKVTLGTGLARTRVARQDAAMLMWERGIIQDPEIMAELMEVPVGTIAPQRAFDIRLARNENLIIASGEDPESGPGTAVAPNSWDVHDIHIREHNNFRKTGEFDSLDDEIKKKFEFHVSSHERMQLEQLTKEAEKQGILQGAAGMQPPGEEPPEEAEPA